MSWFSDLMGGGKNPADAASPYINQIPGQTKQYYDPFFQAGKGSLPSLQEQYASLLGDPGALMNKIGGSYQQSPGLNLAIQQAMQGAGNAAAAGGMAGSPAHEQHNMELATNLANQDYNNWMRNAIGLYGSGLSGQQGMAGMGQQAGRDMADMIAQTLAQQANLKFQDQSQQNQNRSGVWDNIFKGAGAAFSAFNPAFGIASQLAGPMSGTPYSPWHNPG